MDRDITRRDFLNGVAVGVAGSMVAPALLQAAAAEQPHKAPSRRPATTRPG